ncbi:hypothetical protein BAV2481 [Bordetella avium 197N]|uniref:Uncharacterized protein n=1 Tax=Bordetella avium (strain 197N) TaxID=360910 RepID=Q2KXI5_BORA1|nr:hypothetical protein BAV2481 [Bordetella avium 197N]
MSRTNDTKCVWLILVCSARSSNMLASSLSFVQFSS